MRTETQYLLEILHRGVIQVAIDTVYFKPNGEVLTKERHRETLRPGQFKEAEKLLDERRLAIVNAAWTEEVIQDYHEYQESQKEQQAIEESGF